MPPWAIGAKLLPGNAVNPAAEIKALPRIKRVCWPREEVWLLAALQRPERRFLVFFAFRIGVREGELFDVE